MSELQVVTAPKDYTFQLRMNSEIKSELEAIFAGCGVTLSDAINIFLQQTLNEGGFPFDIVPDRKSRREAALRYLDEAYVQGVESVRSESDWISKEELKKRLEQDRSRCSWSSHRSSNRT